MRFCLLLFPCLELGETAMIVVSQAPEVVEGDHLQVGPGEGVWQLLADGFENTHTRLLLDALGKGFLLALGLLLVSADSESRDCERRISRLGRDRRCCQHSYRQ